MLYQVTSRHFCAGLVVGHAGKIILAAPILRWMEGHDIDHARFCCEKLGWGIACVSIFEPMVSELSK